MPMHKSEEAFTVVLCACADDVLDHMPYADAVIREVLRVHSVVDGIWREALEDLEVQGRRIPRARPRSLSSPYSSGTGGKALLDCTHGNWPCLSASAQTSWLAAR
jgi:hypothetical protein